MDIVSTVFASQCHGSNMDVMDSSEIDSDPVMNLQRFNGHNMNFNAETLMGHFADRNIDYSEIDPGPDYNYDIVLNNDETYATKLDVIWCNTMANGIAAAITIVQCSPDSNPEIDKTVSDITTMRNLTMDTELNQCLGNGHAGVLFK